MLQKLLKKDIIEVISMAQISNSKELKIDEGTISFSIDAGKLNFTNNEVVSLFQLNPQNGSIFIIKDADNKIKFFHVYLGKGRTDVEQDVSKLDKHKKHIFVFTWSVTNKEIAIYIDGEFQEKSKINY